MARVEIKGLGLQPVIDRRLAVREGIAFTCTGTVYAAATGSGDTLTGPQLVSNIDGEWPGWLEPGVYTITVPATGKTVTFEIGGFAGKAALFERADALEAGRVTVSGTADDTPGINAKLSSDGSCELRDGIYKILGVVDLGEAPSLTGAGAGRTTLRLGPNGQIRRGSVTPDLTVKGSRTAGITIDGNGVNNMADGGFWVGTVGYHVFDDVKVVNCLGDGAHIDGAQNSEFRSLLSDAHGGHSLVLDYGAGNNFFAKAKIGLAGVGKWGLLIRQSGAAQNGSQFPATLGPSRNTFDTSVFACADGILGCIRATAGQENRFVGGGAGPGTTTFTGVVVSCVLQSPATIAEVLLQDFFLDASGCAAGVPLIDLGDNSAVELRGRCSMYGPLGVRYKAASVFAADPRTVDQTTAAAQQLSGNTPAVSFASIQKQGGYGRTGPRVIGAADEPAFPFAAGWSAYGAGYLPARVYKDGSGRVVNIEGYARNAAAKTANSIILSLPAGWRPAGTVAIHALQVQGTVLVGADGNVTWVRAGFDLPAGSFAPIATQFMSE